eukprot:gnl/TRDRNA2_/TRDRNA2_36724_c0_seq1.p1 gnl/TRDRNA2_/TRDRNA2_36724_c0~~gnl/TRDRNA2_/TRDRNA2_36724_c0_seq1.p1  ORF type:complete len:478 (-),score=152.12 gnl/TRDRNA2_/TRDRNA2_36724_c0_seq1:165-1598(-)
MAAMDVRACELYVRPQSARPGTRPQSARPQSAGRLGSLSARRPPSAARVQHLPATGQLQQQQLPSGRVQGCGPTYRPASAKKVAPGRGLLANDQAVAPAETVQPSPPVESANWAEVVSFTNKMEADEQKDKQMKETDKRRQFRMYLEQQMKEKEQLKTVAKAEEQADYEELMTEVAKRNEAHRKTQEALREKRIRMQEDLDSQLAERVKIIHEERRHRIQEDRDQAAKAAQELADERQAALAKKNDQREAMLKLTQEWAKEKVAKQEEKKQQEQKDKNLMMRLVKLQEADEERRKEFGVYGMQRPRSPIAPDTLIYAARCKHVADEKVMQEVKEANRLADEAQQLKAEEKRKAQLNNLDVLFKQMAEREQKKKEVQRAKVAQRAIVMEDVMAYHALEARKVEDVRSKGLRHRIELERQMAEKVNSKINRDEMSEIEKAFNRRLVVMAKDWNTNSLSSSQQVGKPDHVSKVSAAVLCS